ncbi:MAG: trypsin-like peptidase domain-containing protein [Negativicutes bacterium]|nr:trypsin-like peptidase domain-containing protein [Negativicutes bacterium]
MNRLLRYKQLAPYFIVAVVGALIGGSLVVGYGGQMLAKPTPQNASIAQALAASTAYAQISDARNTPVVRAAQAVGPAVVGITNKAVARDPFNRPVMVEGSGSGVILSTDGYIVTNFHVVENTQQLTVLLADGRTLTGKVVGVDQPTDLAVVKVEATGLPAAVLGDSDSLMVGEPAIAIGNPLGMEFRGSVTVGVISALNRPIEIGERRFKLIQTDAAINPGNSGGALVNADGLIIGINSAKISVQGVEGIGFAIPINSARPIIQAIIEKGKVARSYLGVSLIDKALAARMGTELNIDKGVYVYRTTPNGPAAKADIREGDIILKVAGTETNSVADLRAIVENQPVGSRVEVIFIRGGQTRTVTVILEEMPGR